MQSQKILRMLKALQGCGFSEASKSLRQITRKLSSANFGEDLTLEGYALFRRPNFYVDVGANHPIIASNTFRLHLAGWDGIVVEPNPQLARLHEKSRRNARVFNCGAGSRSAVLAYHMFDPDQYNTFDADAASDALRRGARSLGQRDVQIRPLGDILEEAGAPREIGLLSIDVEGLDLDVLTSNRWDRWTPSFVQIEDHSKTVGDALSSPISGFLRDQSYELVSRNVYTSLYVKRDLVAECLA